jgi:tetratricopeptide (TPR) repeat protein
VTATLRAAAVLLLALGCGSPPPAAYSRETDAAQTAGRQGQHLVAAQHYERAAALAAQPRDAEEARYRAAGSYERAGDVARAEAIYRALAAQGPSAERRARADFALAALWERSGREAAAQEQLASAIRLHPDSGLASAALERHLRYLREQGGSQRALAYLEREGAALSSTELGEALVYRRARELDDAGRTAEARDAYLACAERFPYPGGAYWDDALLRAADKELALGAPQRAISHLSRMLAEQESASIMGSYERARYAEAQLTMGRIYRDVLHDERRARLELRKVWLRHPKSSLVDDALFEEALVARGASDEAGACAALSILVTQRPDSRYAACAHLLCAKLAPAPSACHDYIKRAAGLP